MIKKEKDEEDNNKNIHELNFKWNKQSTLTKDEWNQGQPIVNRSKMKLRSQETNKIFLVFLKIKIILELK